MLELIVVALLQAAAGDPAVAEPAQAQPAQSEAQAETAQEQQEEAAERRRCRARQVTGSRLETLVTCRTRGNGRQDNDTREALHDLQRPAPTTSY